MSGESELIAQIVDIVAEPAGLDSNGALKSGYVVLYSFAVTATLRYRTGTGSYATLLGCEDEDLRLHMDYLEDKQNLVGQYVLCILICRFMTLKPDNAYLDTCGLVLASFEESLYTRVGWYRLGRSDEPRKGYELQEVTII